jgi:hypothetical protein
VTWVRFLVWLDLGMIIYWFYGRTHSPLADAQESARRSPMQSLANFVTVAGGLGVFNGFAMTLLAYLTEWGVTNENTAKWHEIGTTPQQADGIGLTVLGVGIAILIAGIVLAKVSGEGRKQAA